MSSLGIFNKETKTYQKVAGTAEVAVVDAEMSDTSVNTVQNKVIKKYVDEKQVNIDGITLTLDEAKNVIKLADALKDKIGSALQPESIVNNQITTVEGFALDARQANPNIDGSLAKQISDLNGSLNNKADVSYFAHDILNTWIQTPLRENKYMSRLYASFDETYKAFLGVQNIDSSGNSEESVFAVASSRYGFIPLFLDQSKDLNDVIGNYFIEVSGAKNSPKSGANFYGFNISWIENNDFAFQLLFAPNEEQISGSTSPRMYMRSKNGGTWTGWNVIAGTLLS